jgi:tryptophan synthase alpha chain
MARIRKASDLPAVVGFGIKHADDVREAGRHADGVVVGSAVVSIIAEHCDPDGKVAPDTAQKALDLVKQLKTGTPR